MPLYVVYWKMNTCINNNRLTKKMIEYIIYFMMEALLGLSTKVTVSLVGGLISIVLFLTLLVILLVKKNKED